MSSIVRNDTCIQLQRAFHGSSMPRLCCSLSQALAELGSSFVLLLLGPWRVVLDPVDHKETADGIVSLVSMSSIVRNDK